MKANRTALFCFGLLLCAFGFGWAQNSDTGGNSNSTRASNAANYAPIKRKADPRGANANWKANAYWNSNTHWNSNVAPADVGVVGTERDLAFLGAVGDDAHLGAAEAYLLPRLLDARLRRKFINPSS